MDQAEGHIRQCDAADNADMLAIINAAAQAYRGVIPADCWHEPYMSGEELASERADGVIFSGYAIADRLIGVMGVQRRHDVKLIRHAYVLPEWQGHGIGAHLLRHLCGECRGPILVGTWAAADWAIRFYERHGFARVGSADTAPLLQCYWNVPERQVTASIVLARPPLADGEAGRLIAGAAC